MNAPKIDKTTFDDLVERMADKARSEDILPDWNIPNETPGTWPTTDPGLALLKIFAKMDGEVISRLNRVPVKNFEAFLDMIGILLNPAQPARVPLTLYPVEGFANPIFVAAGTSIEAPKTEAHAALTYQTQENFSACDAPLVRMYCIDPVSDEIYDNMPDLTAKNAFQPFNASGTDLQQHMFYLGHSKLFQVAGSTDIVLKFVFAGQNDLLGSVVWEYTDVDGKTKPITSSWDSAATLRLSDVGIIKETEVNGISSLWISGRPNVPVSHINAQIKDIKIVDLDSSTGTGGSDHRTVVPDFAFCNFIGLDITTKDSTDELKNNIYPFGRKPRFFDTFYIANKEVFSKAGADIDVGFTLEDPKPINPPADYPAVDAELTWEYFGGSVWRILPLVTDCKAAYFKVSANRVSLVSLDNSESGDILITPLVDVATADTVSFSYKNTDGQTASGSATVPAGTPKGAAIKAALVGTDKAVEITATTYAGSFEYDGLISFDFDKNKRNLKDNGLIKFKCPLDVQKCEVNGVDDYWIRATITNGDYGRELLESAVVLETMTDVIDGGILNSSTTYYGAYSPRNSTGSMGSSNIISVKTSDDGKNTHGIDMTIPKVAGATEYDIYLSTDPTPMWVGRITEDQRAAVAGIIRIQVSSLWPYLPSVSNPIYRVENRFTPPIISKMTISMISSNMNDTDKSEPLEHCLSYNNLMYEDLTARTTITSTDEGFKPFISLPILPLPGEISRRIILLGFKNLFLDGNISLFFHVDESKVSDSRPPLKWSYLGGDIKLEKFGVDKASNTTKLLLKSTLGFGLKTELIIQEAVTPATGNPFVLSENAMVESITDDGWVVLDRRLNKGFTENPVKASVARRINMQCVDNTDNLALSDSLGFISPGDQNKANLLGNDCYWLMATLEGTGDVPYILGIYPNTVWALQEEAVAEEILGSSDGGPNMIFTFQKSPVLSCEIWVLEGIVFSEDDKAELPAEITLQEVTDGSGNVVNTWVKWMGVDDLFGSDGTSRHYVLDPAMGEVIFGDGNMGMIPPIGSSNIKSKYTWGGGVAGNVPSGEIKSLKDALAGIDKVSNCQPAEGGSDTEVMSSTLERGTHVIRHRNKAVTKEDYERLAKDSSSFIARTRCVLTYTTLNLIVIPKGTEDRPTPSQGLLDLVKEYILERSACSIPDRCLKVVGPTYKDVRISVEIYPTSIDLAVPVKKAVQEILNQYLHPLTGGPNGTGWDFGRSVYRSDLYSMLEDISGVDHAENLAINESKGDLTVGSLEIVCSGNHIVKIMLGA